MRPSIVVVDDFFDDAYGARSFALQQDFSEVGLYPGWRSSPANFELAVEKVEEVAVKLNLVVDRLNRVGDCGSFQITTSQDSIRIHSDIYADWAGVCYLSLNPPRRSGTGFFCHRTSGHRRYKENNSIVSIDFADTSQFDMVDYVENVFNRLIVFDSSLFHSAIGYFGSERADGRLTQVYFFKTRQGQ